MMNFHFLNADQKVIGKLDADKVGQSWAKFDKIGK